MTSAFPTPPPRPKVRADVFPAVLTVSGPPPSQERVSLEKVRVVVTLDQILVFQDSSQGPALVFSERLDSYTPPPRGKKLTGPLPAAQAVTDSGKQLTFHRSQSCGCGSRLKGFDPFALTTLYQAASTRDR